MDKALELIELLEFYGNTVDHLIETLGHIDIILNDGIVIKVPNPIYQKAPLVTRGDEVMETDGSGVSVLMALKLMRNKS